MGLYLLNHICPIYFPNHVNHLLTIIHHYQTIFSNIFWWSLHFWLTKKPLTILTILTTMNHYFTTTNHVNHYMVPYWPSRFTAARGADVRVGLRSLRRLSPGGPAAAAGATGRLQSGGARSGHGTGAPGGKSWESVGKCEESVRKIWERKGWSWIHWPEMYGNRVKDIKTPLKMWKLWSKTSWSWRIQSPNLSVFLVEASKFIGICGLWVSAWWIEVSKKEWESA